MRFFLVTILVTFLSSQAPAAEHAVIPNGGAGAGSLSVIDTATVSIVRSMITATSSSVINNSGFAIMGDSAAVLAVSGSAYILSVVNLNAGKITAQEQLSIPWPALGGIAANPMTRLIYLTYRDGNGSSHIQKIDPINLAVLLDVTLGPGIGLGMAVSPDGQRVYLTGYGYSKVASVQASNLELIGTLPLADSWDAAVSPDSTTFYVAAGQYPNMTMSMVDAATLAVTNTISLASVSTVFGLAISSDGSQLYLPCQADFQGTAIFTLDLATLTVLSVPVVVSGNVVVAQNGFVYVGDGSNIVVFDPVAQSVVQTLTAYSNGWLAGKGTNLYFLNEFSSTLAATGPAPSLNILKTAPAGYLSGAAYDTTNRLLLLADTANNIEVLRADSFQTYGHIAIPNLAYAFLNAGGGAGYATTSTPQVLRFDPVSLQVTGTVSIPARAGDNVFNYSQPALSGSTLYVPFQFFEQLAGPRGESPDGSVPGTGIAVIDTASMTLTATWPFKTLPRLALAPGGGVAYAVIPGASHILHLAQINLSTGKIAGRVQIPGLNTSNLYSNPAVSPDGSTIYFSNNNTLYTFNTQALALTNTVSGIGLTNLAVSPDGGYLYGATPTPCNGCPIQYNLDIVSTSSLTVVGTLPSAYQPLVTLFANY